MRLLDADIAASYPKVVAPEGRSNHRVRAELVRAAFESPTFVGSLGMAGVGSPEMTFGYTSLITGRKVLGVVEGSSRTHEFIPYLAQLNADGKFPFDELIAFYPLDRINEAAADSLAGRVVKPVIRFA